MLAIITPIKNDYLNAAVKKLEQADADLEVVVFDEIGRAHV